MRKIIAAAALAAFSFANVAADQAPADPPEGYQFAAELKKGDAASFEGSEETGGVNISSLTQQLIFEQGPNDCSADSYQEKCDRALLDIKSKGSFDMLFTPAYGGDFDVYLYEADEDGVAGDEITFSALGWSLVADPFGVAGPTEAFTVDLKKGTYALVVYYFAAGGGYTMDVSLG
ncbi:MAG: hypothetical protein ACI867_001465 [Glaciecola sp.]|jgi:hypothetical protein